MLKNIFTTILIFVNLNLFASTGDTTHVLTHNNVLHHYITTSGNYNYTTWTRFPNKSWRKAILKVTFKAPGNGLQCGQWDYLNYVKILRKGSINNPSQNIEIARIITPYGNSFGSKWSYTWFADVTDFAPLMNDSLEVDYNFTGGDGSTSGSSGYKFTLDFIMIEGTPAMQQTSFTQLWNGSFAYGNINNPIENHLTPISIQIDTSASIGRLRLLQTGHGAENNDGCSEFCNKYRLLKWDSVKVDSQQVWRLCGFNGLFPQAGTWVYDRSNWCPGSMVYPYSYDFKTTANSHHTIDIDMQQFVANGSANYVFGSQFFQYKKPIHKIDASIENLINPSSQAEYNRINPICGNPTLTVKNNGSDTIQTLGFQFGIVGSSAQTYFWNGILLPQHTTTITLNNFLLIDSNSQKFNVTISSVNNASDEYPADNSYTTNVKLPSVYEQTMVFIVKTNKHPQETKYEVKDIWGNILLHKSGYNLNANTTYRDTISFPDGCYFFNIYDSSDGGGDGLTFWADTAQGSGYAKIVNLGNTPYITFNSDFGSQTGINFKVGSPQYLAIQHIAKPTLKCNVFPNPNNGNFTVDLDMTGFDDVTIWITDLMGRVICKQEYKNVSGLTKNFNLDNESAGIYLVKISSSSQSEIRKIIKTN